MNFSDLLNTRVEDIEAPKPPPIGSYIAIVSGPPEIGPVGKNETMAAKYKLKLLMAREDVDQSALAEYGGLGDRTLTHTIFLTQDSLFRAKDFFKACGLDETGMSLGEALQAVVNRQVGVKIGHRPSPDGKQLFGDIKEVFAL